MATPTKTKKTRKTKKNKGQPKFMNSFISWAPGVPNHFVYQGDPSWMLQAHSLHIQAKAQVKEKLEQTINVKHPANTTAKFRSKLKSTTDSLTSFLFMEVAPMEIALSAAVDDLKEHLAIATGTKVEKFDYKRLRKVTDLLVHMRFVDFMCKKLKVSSDIRERALEALHDNRQQNLPDLLSLLRLSKAGEGSAGNLQRIQGQQSRSDQSGVLAKLRGYGGVAAASGSGRRR